jgi:HSP20 family protein
MRRWDPLRDLLSLQERMNRLFDESLVPGRLETDGSRSGSWVPLADVYETSETFVVQIELPGVEDEDVEIKLDGDRLEVRGQRRADGLGRPESFYRMERSHGPFLRTFQLSQEVDPDRVVARFRDGLLRLELAKVSQPGGRRERGQ